MRRSGVWRLIVAGLLTTLVYATSAQAHQTKLSSTRMTISGGDVSAQVELNGIDLNVATGVSLTTDAGMVLEDRLASQQDAVHRYVDSRVVLRMEGGPACERTRDLLEPKGDHVLVTEHWRCPQGSQALIYEVTLFHEIDPVSRHMVSVDGDRKFIGLLSVSAPRMSVTQAVPGTWQTFLRYVVSGVEHIAIGYDHIAFLLL